MLCGTKPDGLSYHGPQFDHKDANNVRGDEAIDGCAPALPQKQPLQWLQPQTAPFGTAVPCVDPMSCGARSPMCEITHCDSCRWSHPAPSMSNLSKNGLEALNEHGCSVHPPPSLKCLTSSRGPAVAHMHNHEGAL